MKSSFFLLCYHVLRDENCILNLSNSSLDNHFFPLIMNRMNQIEDTLVGINIFNEFLSFGDLNAFIQNT